MKRLLFVILTLLAGACEGAGRDNEAAPANLANRAAAPDCPEDDLSCGRQRPVVSDGVQPFADPNHYLAVVFPRGSPVCMTRSGNAPHGFFAVYGAAPDCPERPDRPPRFISIHAEFNALSWTELAQARTQDCGPLSGPVRRRLEAAPLRLPEVPSAVCQRRGAPGTIELVVHALGGPWQTQGTPPRTSRYRAAIYYLTLGTTDAHVDEDLARFREVIGSIRIDAGPRP